MAASFQSARAGAGGVSLKVEFDVDGGISALRQKVSASEKEMKLKPKAEWDMDTVAFNREMRRTIKAVEGQKVKMQVAMELDRTGLRAAAQEAGKFKEEFARLDAKFEPGKATGIGWLAGAKAVLASPAAMYAGMAVAATRAGQHGAVAAFGMDSTTRMGGALAAIDSVHSIPIVGTITKAFDDLAGVSRNLTASLEARNNIEARVVARARFTGDPLAIATAEANFSDRDLRRNLNSTRLLNSTSMTAMVWNELTGNEANQEQNLKEAREFNAERMAVAGQVRTASVNALAAETAASSLRIAKKPMLAERLTLQSQLDMDLAAAPMYLKGQVALRNKGTMLEYDETKRQGRQDAWFNAITGTTAAGIRVKNQGLSLADESAYRTTRAVESSIRMATVENGERDRARLVGIGTLAAARAEFMPHSGGYATNLNLAFMPAASDRLGIDPSTRARRRAIGMLDDAIGANGGQSIEGPGGDKATTILQMFYEMVKAALSDNPGNSGGSERLRMQ